MASQPGFLETEATIIQNICLPNKCVYARTDGRCGTKYADEAVIDFAGDGCQTAAVREASSTGLVYIKDMFVIPGSMTEQGFVPFQQEAITGREHKASLTSIKGKVIYVKP